MHHRNNRSIRGAAHGRTIGVALLATLLLVAVLAISGCTSGSGGANATGSGTTDTQQAGKVPAFPVTVTDDAGRKVTIAAEPQRIVSLAPANTEILAGLGLMDKVVGVTTYDDYPPEVSKIEKVGDFVQPNIEAITAAKPDLILATTGVQADVVTQLEGTGATVVAIDPQTLAALYTSIGTVGAVTGASEEASSVVNDMQASLAAIRDEIGGADPVPCFIEIAQNPLYTAGKGTLLDDLITAAGGRNVVTASGYVGYSLEQLLADNPAVYLATKGSMSNPEDLAKRAGYDKLSAVKDGHVYVLDDNLVSRPGPRIVQGVKQIAEALHPDLVSAGN